MTMKSGTGDDPFSDDSGSQEEEIQESDAMYFEKERGGRESEQFDRTKSVDEADGTASESDSPDLPRIMARSSVKEDRDSMIQFFVTEETAQLEDQFEREVAPELDIRVKDLMKLDLREAAYLVAIQHPEETAAIPDEWGYEYK